MSSKPILLLFLINCILNHDYNQQGSNWINLGSCDPSKNFEQSPIDIVTSSVVSDTQNTMRLIFNSNTKFIDLMNKGFTLQADSDWVTIQIQNLKGRNREFQGVQFHLHSKSEHTINGEYQDLEMHIVCAETVESQTQNGNDPRILIALGFLFKLSDQDSPWFRMVDSAKHSNKVFINAYNGLYAMLFEKNEVLKKSNQQLGYWQYEGSLTTRGCDETVHHVIIDHVFDISQTQLDAYRTVFQANNQWGQGNYRSIMPLNGRQINQGTVELVKMNDNLVLHSTIHMYSMVVMLVLLAIIHI